MIYITNDDYLSGPSVPLGDSVTLNNPIIFWESFLRPSDISASGTNTGIVGNTALNMWSPDTYTYWQGDTSPSVTDYNWYVYLTLTGFNSVSSVAIARHDLGSREFSYLVQYSLDSGATWVDVGTAFIPDDDSAIVSFFNLVSTNLWRIKINSSRLIAAMVVGPKIAHVKIGVAMVLQRRIYVGHKPAIISKQVKKIVNGSESGQYLGQEIIRSYHTSSLQQENNTANYIREEVQPFIEHVNGHRVITDTAPATFFFAWRPGDYPEDVIYAWTSENITPENQRSNGMMSWGFEMEAIA
jgi:hypothetical protein